MVVLAAKCASTRHDKVRPPEHALAAPDERRASGKNSRFPLAHLVPLT